MRNIRLEADGRSAEIETPDGWVTVSRCQGRTEINIRRVQEGVGRVIQSEGEKKEGLFPLTRRSLDVYIRSYNHINAGELADDVDLQEAILVSSGREKLRLPIADESKCCDGKDFHSSNCPKIR
jgi:hypothetical protein